MDLHAQISSGEFAQEGTTVIKTVEMHTGGEVSSNVVVHVRDLGATTEDAADEDHRARVSPIVWRDPAGEENICPRAPGSCQAMV